MIIDINYNSLKLRGRSESVSLSSEALRLAGGHSHWRHSGQCHWSAGNKFVYLKFVGGISFYSFFCFFIYQNRAAMFALLRALRLSTLDQVCLARMSLSLPLTGYRSLTPSLTLLSPLPQAFASLSFPGIAFHL